MFTSLVHRGARHHVVKEEEAEALPPEDVVVETLEGSYSTSYWQRQALLQKSRSGGDV